MASPVAQPAPPSHAQAAAAPVAALQPGSAPSAFIPLPDLAQLDVEPTGSSTLAVLPVEVEVGVPVPDFRVKHLLALEAGQVIESRWSHVEDVPLGAGKVQLAWSEFEVLDAQMAVRLTRLA